MAGPYHTAGAQSTVRHDGVYAWLEVTNASVRANTDDFLANRIMAKNSSSTVWIEIGWAETGWHLVDGVPRQFVYTYDTVGNQWQFWAQVTPGQHIDVRIIKSSACVIGNPPCTFHAQLWNHSISSWVTVKSVTLPMDRMYIEEFTEVYMDPDEPATHMAIEIPGNNLHWFETQRRFADGSWALWNSLSTWAEDSSANYITTWYNKHYNFYVKKV